MQGPFVSPDGQWVGFSVGSVIEKVAITGGPPVVVTTTDGFTRGATWGEDGTIVYATGAGGTGLQRVSADGGDPTVLTRPNREDGEDDHLWPEFLPGGQAVLFTITAVSGGLDGAQIAVLDLETNRQTAPLPRRPRRPGRSGEVVRGRSSRRAVGTPPARRRSRRPTSTSR